MLSDTDAVADERSRQAELEDLENVAQKAIKKELKTVLTRYLQTVKPSKNLSKDDFIPDYTQFTTDKKAVLTTERLIGASFLLGMEHVERDRKEKEINATDTEIPPIAFTEAINFLKSKVPLTKDDWLELEPKLRFRAFTVAKLAECDFISTAHTQLLGAFEDGTGYAGFWNRIKATVNDNVFDIRPGYWENVYRTNTQSAYIAGKLQQFEKTQPVAYRLLVIEDSRTSEICKHLVRESGYGVVLPSSHNFWKKYGFPPYHFQCRTGIQGVYKSQIGKDKDLMPENVPMKDFNKFHVQEGFGGNPLENGNWWKMSERQKKRATLFGVQDDIEEVQELLKVDEFAEDVKDVTEDITLAGVKKGNPMSFEEADSNNPNPNFKKAEEYGINCQSCVVCFEARLRGYNVITKGNTKGSMLEKLARDTRLAWLDNSGSHPNYILNVSATTPSKALNWLESEVKENSRYTMQFSWRGRSNGAHIISVSKKNNKLFFYDPQIARTYEDSEILLYLKQLKYTGKRGRRKYIYPIRLLQIDTCTFNKSVVDLILEAKL